MKWLLLDSVDEEQLSKLQSDPRVRAVGPNVVVEQDWTDNLSTLGFPGRWALDQLDQHTLIDPYGGGTPSWSYYQNTGSVHIYMVDSGVDGNHSGFSGRLGNGWGWSGVTQQGYVSLDPYVPCNGHGTIAAGVAAGSQTGVARQAIIHSVRLDNAPFNCNAVSNRLIEGLNWIRNNRILPAVANINTSYGCAGIEGTCQAIEAAVQDLMNAGVTVTVSAGNNAYNACNDAPGRLAGVITVGASNQFASKQSSSSYGPCVAVFAPGENVATTILGGTIGNQHGTSVAAPLAAGVAALIRAEGFTAVREIIVTSATANALSNLGSGSPNRLLYSIHTSVNMFGPGWISSSGYYTWTAQPIGGTDTKTLTWYKSWNGSTWFWVGSGNEWTSYIDLADPSFLVRVVLQTGIDTINYDQQVLVSGS
ncbi:MAG: S8 family serine peptidase [Longimicrobiales bacterium]